MLNRNPKNLDPRIIQHVAQQSQSGLPIIPGRGPIAMPVSTAAGAS